MPFQVMLAFLCYFLILLGIAFFSHKKSTTESDFIIGDRSLNFWVTALSAHASDMSNWLFMAFPMAVFTGGLPKISIAFGLLFGMFLAWTFIAPKLRLKTEEFNCFTLPSLFEKHFKDSSGSIRALSAIMGVIFTLHYLSAGFIGIGFIFESTFNIDYHIGLTVAATVITLYVFVGGFVTVAWTDLFQGVFLLIVLCIVPFIAFSHLDHGFQQIQEVANKNHIPISFFHAFSFTSLLDILLLMSAWGLGYFGQLHVLTKFMGIKDPKDLKKAKIVGLTWQFLALLAATFVGLIGIAYFDGHLDNPELVFVNMVHALFNPFVGGFVLCAILAATISTMDSLMLVSASILTEDIYKKLIDPQAPSKKLLKISRASVVVTTAIAYFIAWDKNKTVMDSVEYSWAGLGCSFGPLLLATLYSKTANKYGAIAGIVSGGVIAGIWPSINPYIMDKYLPAMIPGFLISLSSIFLVSNLTNKYILNKK